MSGGRSSIVPAGALTLIEKLTPDEQLMRLWLSGLSRHTQRAYRRDVGLFLGHAGKALAACTLVDVQQFAEWLEKSSLCAGSRHRTLSAIKSLFAFATRIGFLQYDVARVLRLPACKDQLNERILTQDQVRQLIAAADPPARDKLLLRLIYHAGLRVSEAAGLRWRDATAHAGGGVITVFGKGGKTRAVHLESPIWSALMASRGSAGEEDPIFRSRQGGALDSSQVRRIVKRASRRAGLSDRISTHWLRHCHASHALDGGASISLVQATLGHSNVATTSRYLHARPRESSSKFLADLD